MVILRPASLVFYEKKHAAMIKVHSTFCAAAIFDNESIKQRLYYMCFLDLHSGDYIYLWTCGKFITQRRRKLSCSSWFCYHGNIRKQGLCILYKVQILATCWLWNRGLERLWKSKSRSYVHRTLRSISDVSWEQNVVMPVCGVEIWKKTPSSDYSELHEISL